jgi:hypothetical protein
MMRETMIKYALVLLILNGIALIFTGKESYIVAGAIYTSTIFILIGTDKGAKQ